MPEFERGDLGQSVVVLKFCGIGVMCEEFLPESGAQSLFVGELETGFYGGVEVFKAAHPGARGEARAKACVDDTTDIVLQQAAKDIEAELVLALFPRQVQVKLMEPFGAQARVAQELVRVVADSEMVDESLRDAGGPFGTGDPGANGEMMAQAFYGPEAQRGRKSPFSWYTVVLGKFRGRTGDVSFRVVNSRGRNPVDFCHVTV